MHVPGPKAKVALYKKTAEDLTKIQSTIVAAKDSGEVTPTYLAALISAYKLEVIAPRINVPAVRRVIKNPSPWVPIIAFLTEVCQDKRYFVSRPKTDRVTFEQTLDACAKTVENAIRSNLRKAEEIEAEETRKQQEAAEAINRAAEAARLKREKDEQRNAAFISENPVLAADLDAIFSGELRPQRERAARMDADGHMHFTPESFVRTLIGAVERNVSVTEEDVDDMADAVKSAVRWIVVTLANKRAGDYTTDEIETLLSELVPVTTSQFIRFARFAPTTAMEEARSWVEHVRKNAFDRRTQRRTNDTSAFRSRNEAAVQQMVDHDIAKNAPTEPATETVAAKPAKPVDTSSVERLHADAQRLEKDKPEEALKHVEQARKLDPNNQELIKLQNRIEHAQRMAKQKVVSTDLTVGTMKPVIVVKKKDDSKGKGKKKGRSSEAQTS